MSFEVPKKVLVILVHQGAAKLPALKVFVASKLENLLHRMLFLSVKNVWGLAVLQPLCAQGWLLLFGSLKTHINWCEKPKKFVACLTPTRHSRKNVGLCTNHLIENVHGAVFIRYHCRGQLIARGHCFSLDCGQFRLHSPLDALYCPHSE